MVVRDEEFYISMCLQSILPYIDGLYILDTGSTDRTIEIITEFSTRFPNKIICETKLFGGNYRFDVGYQEKAARNYALSRARSYFNPDWIICMDADEVYTRNFWEVWDTLSPSVGSIGHSTECPTTHSTMSRHPLSMVYWGQHRLHDPHCRIWNVHKYTVEWIQPINRHVVLSHNETNDLICDFILEKSVHFHFHHTFGPKSFYSWVNKGLLTQPGNCNGLLPDDIYSVSKFRKQYPKLFNEEGIFLPPKGILIDNAAVSIDIPIESKLGNDVIQKWLSWGDFSIK